MVTLSLSITPEDQRLDLILNIGRLIVRNLTFEEQQMIVNRYLPSLSSQISETNAVFIMNIFIPLRQNVNFSIISNFIETLYNLVVNSNYSNIRLITCKFIAVILNKMNDNEYFQSVLLHFKEKITNTLEVDVDIGAKQTMASLQIWLTKAIVTKGSCNVDIFLDEVCKSCSYVSYVIRI